MHINNIVDSLKQATKEINIKELPTQGYFYPDDFTLKIKKASIDDIILYNHNYIKDDINFIRSETERILKNNTIYSSNYSYNDIKVNDRLYIFLEIVKFTMNKDIYIPYRNILGEINYVAFGSNTFNYYDFSKIDCEYDDVSKQFIKNDYKFTLPSVGIDNCLIDYLMGLDDDEIFENYNYYFMFFIGNKNFITTDEINNLIIIFNEDMDDEEFSKINEIVAIIYPTIIYSLKTNDGLINLDLSLDFENLFI